MDASVSVSVCVDRYGCEGCSSRTLPELMDPNSRVIFFIKINIQENWENHHH